MIKLFSLCQYGRFCVKFWGNSVFWNEDVTSERLWVLSSCTVRSVLSEKDSTEFHKLLLPLNLQIGLYRARVGLCTTHGGLIHISMTSIKYLSIRNEACRVNINISLTRFWSCYSGCHIHTHVNLSNGLENLWNIISEI